MALNVLVVDDSAVMRSIIIKTLRLGGLNLGKILQASNGQEALDILDENWVDLALVDINMPVMTGEEFIEQVRRQRETADLSILVVSTEGSSRRIEAVRRMGAEFLHKPFTPELLRETVVRITGVENEQIDSESIVQRRGYDF
jgi:two-component system, chemotaxis family, chemotaxis protein CheY